MSKSTKPDKPYEGFPLFSHANRSWAKKIRGRLHYFGRWSDPEGALERFNKEWPYLKDGRTPPQVDTGDDSTVRVLCNAFLASKQNKLDAGELSQRSFQDYYQTCAMLVDHFRRDRRVDDLRPDDFAGLRKSMAKTWGPVKIRNEITRTKMVFKFGLDERMIDRPVHFDQSFTPPSAKVLRKARNEAGQRMFEASELRRILDAADVQVRAMTLLGLNAGFGNTDVASLPLSAVDLDGRWIDFPRPKTEIMRRIPLWPETVEALHAAIAKRPKAAEGDDADLCFLTYTGKRWVRVQESKTVEGKFTAIDPLTQRFSRLLKRLGVNGRRGLGFYTLRHVFETIAGESKDQVAVNAIMGHVDNTMAGVYRERISDERLQAVVDVVSAWLSSAS